MYLAHKHIVTNSGNQQIGIQMVLLFQLLLGEGFERTLPDRACHFEVHDAPGRVMKRKIIDDDDDTLMMMMTVTTLTIMIE